VGDSSIFEHFGLAKWVNCTCLEGELSQVRDHDAQVTANVMWNGNWSAA
jgi:hypothetical protein